MTGVPPSGSGCQPTASAATASSRSGIPNADLLDMFRRLLDRTLGVERGLLKTDAPHKLIRIRVGELRLIATCLKLAKAELLAASGTEAGTAETGTGSVHDGSVSEAETPDA